MAIPMINGSPVWEADQTLVMYLGQGDNPASYPRIREILAPIVDSENPTRTLYHAGNLLARYGTNAPSPELVGTYVNFDPASSNADQKICIGVLVEPMANNMVGIDTTNAETATQTINRVEIVLFGNETTGIRNIKMYEKALTDNNSAAVITGFKAQFSIVTITTTYYKMDLTNVISLQGRK